jgi:hypothetical protein
MPEAGACDRMETDDSGSRWRSWIVSLCVALMFVVAILGIPRGAGPDEAEHLARGAALVRGQLNGESGRPNNAYSWVNIPWWVVEPNPACYAFNQFQPVNCTSVPQSSETPTIRWLSRTVSYPPTAHILAGAATLLPGEARTAWLARVLNGLVPAALICWSLSTMLRSRSPLLPVCLLVSLTPSVWFFSAVVNPSGWVGAGAVAMWTALVVPPAVASPARRQWLYVAGWCAACLCRFDGLAWSIFITAVGVLWGARGLLRGLVARPLLVAAMAVTAAINVGWTIHHNRRQFLYGGRVVVLLTTAITVAVLITVVFNDRARNRSRDALNWMRNHTIVVAVPLIVIPVIGFLIRSTQLGGAYSTEIGNTGQSLSEAVGVLGWVDTYIPTVAFYVWFAALGLIAFAGMMSDEPQRLRLFILLAVSMLTLQWFLQVSIAYWHGRYLFPVVTGLAPLAASLFDRTKFSHIAAKRLRSCVGLMMFVVLNLAFVQTLRRFAVGSHGIMNPLRWETYNTILPKWLLLVIYGISTAALCLALVNAPIERVHRSAKSTSQAVPV